MEIRVRVFLGDKLIESSELHKLTILNPTVDRTINDVVDRNSEENEKVIDVKMAS